MALCDAARTYDHTGYGQLLIRLDLLEPASGS